MIKHIVMWKLVESFEGQKKAEIAGKIKQMIEGLRQTIPQIVEVEVGVNFNESDASYDVSLYSVFKSKQDLDIYQNHPEHQKVASFIAKVRVQRVVCDYEI